MCAVMGPSGAGKTTLLDIISKRKNEGKILGKVGVRLFDILTYTSPSFSIVLFSPFIVLLPRNEPNRFHYPNPPPPTLHRRAKTFH